MLSQLDSWLIWLAGSHVTRGGRREGWGRRHWRCSHPQNHTCPHRKYGLLLSNVMIWVGAGLESLAIHPVMFIMGRFVVGLNSGRCGTVECWNVLLGCVIAPFPCLIVNQFPPSLTLLPDSFPRFSYGAGSTLCLGGVSGGAEGDNGCDAPDGCHKHHSALKCARTPPGICSW